MESCPTMSINVSDVIASVKTLGFATGVVLVLSIELILLLVYLMLRMRNKRSRIQVPSNDDNLGEFSVSFATIRSHLRSVLYRSFPQLQIKRISLFKCGNAYATVIDAYADISANMIKLRDTVRQELQSSLTNRMGLEGIFTKIDVKICGLNAAPVSNKDVESTSEPQSGLCDEDKNPKPLTEDQRPKPLSLVKDLENDEPSSEPVR